MSFQTKPVEDEVPTKSIELEAWIIDQVEIAGGTCSRSKANRLKKQFMRDGFNQESMGQAIRRMFAPDPNDFMTITYKDPTGEEVVQEMMNRARA